MKLVALLAASAVALSTGLALAQSASGTAGGSSKAGGPSATAGTTGASKSGTTTGGMSARHRPRHHRKHSELSGMQFAQGGAPSGRGAITGDPAASSATPGTAPTTGNSMKSNPSGSGTSTSGGKDDNGDQGRDKMPESNKAVRPDNKPDRM
jgi:hypothetical protein